MPLCQHRELLPQLMHFTASCRPSYPTVELKRDQKRLWATIILGRCLWCRRTLHRCSLVGSVSDWWVPVVRWELWAWLSKTWTSYARRWMCRSGPSSTPTVPSRRLPRAQSLLWRWLWWIRKAGGSLERGWRWREWQFGCFLDPGQVDQDPRSSHTSSLLNLFAHLFCLTHL